MHKGTWIGGLVILGLGGGYLAGVYCTSSQVSAQYQDFVAAVTENYQGFAKVSSELESSMFSSTAVLSLEFKELPAPAFEWAQTKTINFAVDFSHGFLSSHSVVSIAKGELLDKIKGFQAQSDQQPLMITTDYRYDILTKKVRIEGQIFVDGFTYSSDDVQLNVGSTQGPFTVSGREFKLDIRSQQSDLVFGGADFKLGEMTLTQSVKVLEGEDILTTGIAENSQVLLKVASLDVQGREGVFAIDEFAMGINQHIEGQRVVVGVNYTAKAVSATVGAEEVKFDNPVFKLAADVDLEAAISFVKELKDLQRANNGRIEDPMAIFPLLSGLTQKGVNAKVERLAFSVGDDRLEGEANLKMAPFAVEEIMLDRKAALAKVDLEASLTLPKKLIASMPNLDVRQLDFFVGLGFLVDEGEDYGFTLAVKKGEIKLNGKVMPAM